MVVTAVTGVDDGNSGGPGRHHRGAFLGVAHGDDVGIAAYNPHGVSHALAFGGGGGRCLAETQNRAAQLQHSGFKAQTGPGGGLEEQGSQLFPAAAVGVLVGVGDDVFGGGDQPGDFLFGQIGDIH